MQGARQLAVEKIRENRQRYQQASDAGSKQQAADGFKTALIALTVALKSEENEMIKNELKKRLPDLELELMKMYEGAKASQKLSGGGGGSAGGNGPSKAPTGPGSSNPNGPKTQPTDPSKPKTQLQTNLEGAIVREKPNVKWQDVAGLDGAKKALKEAVILPIKFPEIFVGQRRPWKGILLYGPPGTGKTYLAKACATQMQQGTFFSISSSDLMSKYVGESERTIKTLFQMARNQKPSIIFIDEIDSLTSNRTEGENQASRRVKTEFLVQMDGVGNETQGVLVLGATNLPWALDPAVRRRFERRIYIPLPDLRARIAQLTNLIKNNPNDITEDDLQVLAEKTEGFSGSDISVLIRDAMFEPLRFCQLAKRFRKVMDEGQVAWSPCPENQNIMGNQYKSCGMHELPAGSIRLPPLTMQHFLMALQKSKPSVNQKDIEQYIQWTKSFGQDG